MSPTVHILILAAGASSRMRGSDKLLQDVGGQPLLRRVAEVAMATGAPVTVTIPPDNAARRAALSGLAVTITEIPDAVKGMSRSIREGIGRLLVSPHNPEDGVMILPADMPGFTAPVLSDLIARFQADPTRILRGTDTGGQAGHPALFPRDLWPELAKIEGDEGGRSVLQRHPQRVVKVALPGGMASLDLDTPEDWAAWRLSTDASRGK